MPLQIASLINLELLADFFNKIGPFRPIAAQLTFGRCWRNCVAKVESCKATNFHENSEEEAIADSYNLNRVTEVA